jgi:hypothetical protein
MIINIRGTHGSGKSTLVKQVMERYKAVPESYSAKGGKKSAKPVGYVMESCAGKLFVVGPYETACGGCDAVQPYALIWPKVVEYAAQGHVLFEGALVSSSYGNIGRDSEVYGDDFVFAFLNTPLDVCLERIRKRRESKGNTKPLDPKNTRVKFENVQRSYEKITGEFNRRAVILDYRRPMPALLGLLLGN